MGKEWLLLRKCSETAFGCNYQGRGGGVKYRASTFIKTVFEAAFGFHNILQITKAALNHVDNIESITSDPVGFDFIGFNRRVEIIIVTAVVNIGHVVHAVLAVAPKLNREWPGHC